MWQINRNSNVPLYLQIVDMIEQKISYGVFSPGSKLPSERKLAELLGVHRSTISLAYLELRSKGIVDTLRGKGTLVNIPNKNKNKILIHPPQWEGYLEKGNLHPNLPLLRVIRESILNNPTLIDFASGKLSEDLVPINKINEIMHQYNYNANFGYDFPNGYLPLRMALVNFLKEYRNIHTTEESILITTGTQQSLFLIAQSLLSPGDAIAVENPSFLLSLPMFKSLGLKLYRIPTDKQGIIPEEIRSLYRKHKIKMLFVNPNYQNPTGCLLNQQRKDALIKIAAEIGIPIVEDDSLSLATFEKQIPSSLKTNDQIANIIHIGSFSKIAAAGLRIGWIVAPFPVIKRLADARRQMDLGFNIIPQHIAAEYMKSDYFSLHLTKLRKELLNKRNITIRALQAEMNDYVKFTIPHGGLHLWCKISPKINDRQLLQNSINNGVIYVPGSVYGSENGYMRLTFARPHENEITQAITKLAISLKPLL
ncbi:PLP-dependent aminotransferase family protein [Niallia circulans]|uniref:PLP-dependent aminotransferase family protein n=1 Tax=Niallia circulans TaxID=1397 RepID=A0A941GF71_NIACI|nr:PLP-dependent aminotransferase family protein [Niallia circulans]MCB5236403.1 PLP-dependent aminotransferase family protein [Niallia circulans]